ncbi:MAG: hypothetical protein J7L89_08880 [Bacteroidales bacterium]|nr:hypothetical protein [Bacteroidales bacterium]
MTICGILGFWESGIVILLLLVLLFPLLLRKFRGNRVVDMTEKIDQLERIERMFREGSLSEREFKKQKRKIMKGK